MRGVRSRLLSGVRLRPRACAAAERADVVADGERARARRAGARAEEDQSDVRSDLPQIHEALLRPRVRLALLQGAGLRRERAQGERRRVGSARAASCSSCRRRIRRSRRTGPSSARSISPSGTSPRASCTIAISGICGARTSATESAITSCSRATTPARARSPARSPSREAKVGRRSGRSVELIAPTVHALAVLRETLGYVRRIDSTYAKLLRAQLPQFSRST